jgi:nitrate reductase delta subunit
MTANTLYKSFASLLEYPDASWHEGLDAIWEPIASECPTAIAPLLDFSRDIDDLALTGLQERYTQTFDLNPVCTLDIGYHLFGENYKRGVFLANLRETERLFDLGQAAQLPDYLPVLLRLLGKLEDADLRQALINDCLIPALRKMVEALVHAGSPYAGLVKSLDALMRLEETPGSGERGSSLYEAVSAGSPELYHITPRAAAQRQRSN